MSYSPTLGRWMEQDPAGYVDGGDLYQADDSSPVSFADPLGLYVPSFTIGTGHSGLATTKTMPAPSYTGTMFGLFGGNGPFSSGRLAQLQAEREQMQAMLDYWKAHPWETEGVNGAPPTSQPAPTSTTQPVAGVPIHIVGDPDPKTAKEIGDALNKILETDRGKVLAGNIRKCKGSVDIQITNNQPTQTLGDATAPNSNGAKIIFNPGGYPGETEIKVRYPDGSVGTVQASLTRRLAHELGHAAGGCALDPNNRDDKARNANEQNNININENPIMKRLGEGFDRIEY